MQQKLPRFITAKEAKFLFNVSQDHPRDNLILKCFFYLGLRNSELRKLEKDDIDLINGTIKVVQGKGYKDRIVNLPTHLGAELENWLNHCDKIVFKGRGNKGLLNDRTIRRIVKKYAMLAGIRKASEIHPHTLRHSYATLLQNRDVPLNAIQAALGHKNLETTTIYMHLGVEKRGKLIQKAFDDAFRELS